MSHVKINAHFEGREALSGALQHGLVLVGAICVVLAIGIAPIAWDKYGMKILEAVISFSRLMFPPVLSGSIITVIIGYIISAVDVLIGGAIGFAAALILLVLGTSFDGR
jgi:hypothetical protein